MSLIAQIFVSSNCLYFHQIIIIFPIKVTFCWKDRVYIHIK